MLVFIPGLLCYRTTLLTKLRLKAMESSMSDSTAQQILPSGLVELEKQTLKKEDGNREPLRVCTQSERKKHIQKICNHIPMNYRRIPALYVSHKHKVAFCEVTKSACTTAKTVLVDMELMKTNGTIPNNEIIHQGEFLKQYGIKKEKYTRRIRDYLKFIIVRDPFSRLVSAYRDKMSINTGSYKYHNIRENIINWYYKNRTNETFIRYPKKMLENIMTKALYNDDIDYQVKMPEFISFIQSDKKFHDDIHFRPYILACNPCIVQYDIIMRQETLDYDAVYLLSKIPHRYYPNLLPIRNKKTDLSGGINLNPKNLTNYFKDVSLEQMEKLKKTFFAERIFLGYRFNLQTLTGSCSIRTENGENCC